jgi:hypothetical protein
MNTYLYNQTVCAVRAEGEWNADLGSWHNLLPL